MQAVDGKLRLAESGANLASVLDALRDRYPERFEMFNEALTDWFPEFDKVLFEVPGQAGLKAIALRTRDGQYSIPVTQLSDGTRLALALLAVTWLPEPPTIVGIEEPDRGIHPRLLHKVHDALVRLAYPEQFGEERPPVQVIATTHSPYLVDLFKDHPEHVVIANKTGLEVTFRRLSESDELLQELDKGPSLGEIWFSGLLGGVP
ncbi:MAG: hypothetical protein KatS3mg110_3141 [Pirellulaceae bacterium]|nr:MAG: hypothetical protein KatS3mg110_3141 [Pirellulaceae bacterium]